MGWLSSTLGSIGDALGFGGGGGSAPAPASSSGDSSSGIDWGNVATNVITGVVSGGAGAAAGYAVGTATSGASRRRRRKRKYPTANQWARFEQANDMLKGHPNAPAMRRQLSWKFFSRFSWM